MFLMDLISHASTTKTTMLLAGLVTQVRLLIAMVRRFFASLSLTCTRSHHSLLGGESDNARSLSLRFPVKQDIDTCRDEQGRKVKM